MTPYPDLKSFSFIAGANVPQTSRIKKKKQRRIFIPPTQTFPYKIPKRLDKISQPRDYYNDSLELCPVTQLGGVRKSALTGVPSQRILEVAMPHLRHLVFTRNWYKHVLKKDRLEKLDQLVQTCKATCYTKFCKALIEQQTPRKTTLKKTETLWRKHLDYLSEMAKPRQPPEPEPVKRGDPVPLSAILPRLKQLSQPAEKKTYRRLSQETWYRPPGQVESDDY